MFLLCVPKVELVRGCPLTMKQGVEKSCEISTNFNNKIIQVPIRLCKTFMQSGQFCQWKLLKVAKIGVSKTFWNLDCSKRNAPFRAAAEESVPELFRL